MMTIEAYQFSGTTNLYIEDESDIYWLEGCLLRLFISGIPKNPKNPIIAKWIIKPKSL